MQNHIQMPKDIPHKKISSLSDSSGWQSTLPLSLRNQVLETVLLLAERLCKPEEVLSVAEKARAQTEKFHWVPASFTSGFGSLVLPYLYLARVTSEKRWEDLARLYLRLAVNGTHHAPIRWPGVLNGSSGLGIAITLFARYDERYHKICETLSTQVAAQVLKQTWRRKTFGVAADDYDLVSGAAGILGYLVLTRSRETIVQDAIQRLLEYLTWLGSKNESENKNWFIPPRLFHHYEGFPNGYFNLGLAHGIPGPLAALSLAWQDGYRVDGQRAAMQEMSYWLTKYRLFDDWGVNWPAHLPLEIASFPNLWSGLHPARAAWCYGAPGVTRALWLAGTALEDKELHQLAVEGIEAVIRRPSDVRNIASPTLCHGMGGLLTILTLFVREIDSIHINRSITEITQELLSTCNSSYTLGVRDLDGAGNLVDHPGFLLGSAGVMLALLTTLIRDEPTWARALLIV
jgi:lantibiotic biosynthesis protein